MAHSRVKSNGCTRGRPRKRKMVKGAGAKRSEEKKSKRKGTE